MILSKNEKIFCNQPAERKQNRHTAEHILNNHTQGKERNSETQSN